MMCEDGGILTMMSEDGGDSDNDMSECGDSVSQS